MVVIGFVVIIGFIFGIVSVLVFVNKFVSLLRVLLVRVFVVILFIILVFVFFVILFIFLWFCLMMEMLCVVYF